MTSKMISKLISASYVKGTLDAKKVNKIASILPRADLKVYIRGLKLSEKDKMISLVLPNRNLYNKTLTSGIKKRIEVIEDSSLLLGLKIIDNDMVYDLSLKNNLERFVNSL